jgi:hypothetical protein
MATTDAKDSSAHETAGCVAMLLVWPFVAVWQGYVLSLLWAWFVVGTFHAPAISIGQAVGLSLTVGMFTTKPSRKKDGEKTDYATLIVNAFLAPLFFLAFGWIVHQFV